MFRTLLQKLLYIMPTHILSATHQKRVAYLMKVICILRKDLFDETSEEFF